MLIGIGLLVSTLFQDNLSDKANPISADKSPLFETELPTNTIEVSLIVQLSDQYFFFGDGDHIITTRIRANISDVDSPTITLKVPFEIEPYSITSPNMNYSMGLSTGPQRKWGIVFFLSPNDPAVNIEVKSRMSYTGLFWRNSAEVPSFEASSNFGSVDMKYLIIPAPDSGILNVYSRRYQELQYQNILVEGQIYLVPDENMAPSTVILYESSQRNILTGGLLLATIGLIASQYLSRVNRPVRRIEHNLKKIYRIVANRVDSNWFLSAYALCAFLMISLSFYGGPDPRTRVYVLANPSTSLLINSAVEEIGGRAISIYDTTDMVTLSSIGAFDVFIVADYISPTIEVKEGRLHPALRDAPLIFLLSDKPGDFQEEVKLRFPSPKLREVNSANLAVQLNSLPEKRSPLGLQVDLSTFKQVAMSVGVLSFAIVFFGLAFFSTRIIKAGNKPGLGVAFEAIMYAVSYFVLTMAIYMTAGVLLGIPIGLHAVTSGSREITAMGLLGFGGGSRPRMLIGLAGFLVGVFVAQKHGVKIDRNSIMIVLFFIAVLLLGPLTSSVVFHEFVLLFSVGPFFETATSGWTSVRFFITTMSESFGAWVSPTYAFSNGIVLYFMGAISFFFYTKAQKTTRVLLFLFSAFAISQGGIRVAEMSPWKVFTGVVPGTILAFIVVFILGLVSKVETTVRLALS